MRAVFCAVEDCSVRSVADTILGRLQTHLKKQSAEHKRRLVQLTELRTKTPRPLTVSAAPR